MSRPTIGSASGNPSAPTTTARHVNPSAKLRAGGLVTSRRDGRRVVHRARDSHLRTVIVEALSQAEHTVRGLPPGHS